MADLARQMFRDCTYDLKEISQCRDCYRFANEENPTKFWFCKPCRPFHELVSNFCFDPAVACIFRPKKCFFRIFLPTAKLKMAFKSNFLQFTK